MGLLKGNLTFSRYRIEGEAQQLTSKYIDENLKKFAFHNRPLSSREKITGWTNPENILDSSFDRMEYAIGDYLIFSLRIDRKVIPPSLFKVKIMEREKAYREEKGIRKIHRDQREEIRDALQIELMGKIQPVPSFHDLCWARSSGTMLFCSLSEKAIQDFQDVFKESFQMVPVSLHPWESPYLDASTADRIFEAQRREAFEVSTLGGEFLTWLWFKSDEGGGAVAVAGLGDLGVTFARRLVLKSGEGNFLDSVICQGLHAGLQEGKAALRQGKRIREARIILERDSQKWEFTFKADRFSFQSLQLPETGRGDDDSNDLGGRILERIYLVELAVETMDRLFALFLDSRLSRNWADEFSRMAAWWNR
ncbi:MAG: recombination-associated protein RdgC [Deltaproteobacteria bacterium]|nr:recombination-associated protein RdgC [Deltaproteobacteria bacterium]